MSDKQITTSEPIERGLVITEAGSLAQHPAAVYLGTLASSGRRTQRIALERVAGLLIGVPDCLSVNWAALRYQHLQVLRTKLIEAGYKPATVNKTLVAVRMVLKQAWLLGFMSAQDYQAAAQVKNVNGKSEPAGRSLTMGELGALVRACEQDKNTLLGVRNAALLACMYPGGLRREEVVGLDISDCTIEQNGGELIIRLLVHGKRSKERIVFLDNGGARAVAAWVAARGAQPGALFMGVTKNSKLSGRGITAQALYKTCSELAAVSGIAAFTPHDLRRSVASDLLDCGEDISVVADILGHENVNTTRRYDRRGERAKRRAVSKLHLPYRGK